MTIIPNKIASKIDAKVIEGKVVPNWRLGWKFGSIRAYAVIFLFALAQGGLTLAAPVAVFWTLWPTMHLVMSALMIALCFVGTYSALTKQQNLKPPNNP